MSDRKVTEQTYDVQRYIDSLITEKWKATEREERLSKLTDWQKVSILAHHDDVERSAGTTRPTVITYTLPNWTSVWRYASEPTLRSAEVELETW